MVLYHKGSHCTVCHKGHSRLTRRSVVGPLNRCARCASFDLCESCSANQKEMHHGEHVFITIPFPLVNCTASVDELLRAAPNGSSTFMCSVVCVMNVVWRKLCG
jgi:hypothetical protein